MAGGTFNLSTPKVRPGTYVNVIKRKRKAASNPLSGIAVIPLFGYDWGPREEWIHLTTESLDAEKAKLGRSIEDDNPHMMLLRLMFLNAVEAYVYIPEGGEQAVGTIPMGTSTAEVRAKYPGTLGNSIKAASEENPLGGFDVSVFLGDSLVEFFEGVKTAADLSGSSYIEVEGGEELASFAAVSLSGGTDDQEKLNASISKFLDMSEKIRFNCMAFPTEDKALISAMITKIRYIRNAVGWKCTAVAADTAADYEGIYNLTNSFEYESVKLTTAQASAWLAGAAAGAGYKTSLTYTVVEGAQAVVGEKTNEKAIQSIKSGETFFSVDETGNVILEYDVNSKVTFAEDEPEDINKGRPCRVYDTFANELLITFVPGKFNNNSEGWSVMEGIGKTMLQQYENDGAIKNADLDEDFKVDQGSSAGDSVYINAGIQPLDSAEKYYFTVVAG